jgi:hypothetical protein
MIENPKLITQYNGRGVNIIHPIPFILTLKKADYDAGYVIRYFAGRINDRSNIIEISYGDYVKLDTSFYKKASVRWKISGVKNNIVTNNVLEYVGVVEHNLKQIDKARLEFPNIDLILNDPTQFWKPSKN